MGDPSHIAANDQERKEAQDFAGLIADYFHALLTRGLERTEALKLARDYQAERLEAERE